MLRTIKISHRIPLIFSAIILPVIASVVWISQSSISSVIDDAEKRELQSNHGAVVGVIESQGALAVGLALRAQAQAQQP